MIIYVYNATFILFFSGKNGDFSVRSLGRGEAVTILWCNYRVGHIQIGVAKVDKVQSTDT